MAVLMLVLSGPLQSWGDSSRFTVRQTRREPTKSGVVGLLAAALGRGRGEEIGDLRSLEMGVRIDQPGSVIRDFQTERPMNGGKPMPLSQRYYLSDAKFLVALNGPQSLLDDLERALRSPVWPLYLGRRSCPPDGPLAYRCEKGPYEDVRVALRTEPWIASEWYRKKLSRREGGYPELEIVCDARDGETGELCSDLPLSFGEVRRYGRRKVVRFFVRNPDGLDVDDALPPAFPLTFGDHDPMSYL